MVGTVESGSLTWSQLGMYRSATFISDHGDTSAVHFHDERIINRALGWKR